MKPAPFLCATKTSFSMFSKLSLLPDLATGLCFREIPPLPIMPWALGFKAKHMFAEEEYFCS